MKSTFIFSALLLCVTSFAQTDFSRADELAATFSESYTDAGDLARKLTQTFQTEEEKARVLFMWIAHNIRYDCDKFRNPSRPKLSARSKEELQQKISVWEEKETAKSLKGKRGICADYSKLFKTMCDAVGLEAVVVTGDARDFYKPYRNSQDNPHAWNAIKVNGQWQLLDATWAAGYVNPEVTKFTRKVSQGYFNTPPAWFAQSHFPEEERWQLLEPPVGKKSFPDQPLINFGQMDYPLQDFSTAPQPGANGNGYEIRFKFAKTPKEFRLTTSNSRPVDFEKTEENGWTVLRFTKKNREIVVFCGESQRSKMDWLARYEMK